MERSSPHGLSRFIKTAPILNEDGNNIVELLADSMMHEGPAIEIDELIDVDLFGFVLK